LLLLGPLACNPGTAEIPPGYVTGPCVAGDCLGGGGCLSEVCLDPAGLEDDGGAADPDGTVGEGDDAGPSSSPTEPDDGDGSGGTDDGAGDAGDDAPTSGDGGSADAGEDSGDPPPPDDTGTGTGEPCDLFEQDCGPGLKCNPTSADGITWTGICVEPGPALPGEPCMLLGSELDGLDDCTIGSVCTWTEGDALGFCQPLCLGAAPPDGGCLDDDAWCFDAGLPLCLDTCDPLQPSCAAGWGCYLAGELFACVPDESGNTGAQGQPCDFQTACDPSRVCVLAEFDTLCFAGTSCCANVCDVESPICAPGRDCFDLFTSGKGDAAHPDVGVCLGV
jgi:hypothetical protein